MGPIVSQTLSDVFCDNEYGPNFLFRNNGDGTFTEVAQQAGERKRAHEMTSIMWIWLRMIKSYYRVPVGVEDPMQHGRGVALADFNRDGKTDIVYGNWNGPHRLYMQQNNRKQKFKVGSHGFPGDLTNNNIYTKTSRDFRFLMKHKVCIPVWKGGLWKAADTERSETQWKRTWAHTLTRLLPLDVIGYNYH